MPRSSIRALAAGALVAGLLQGAGGGAGAQTTAGGAVAFSSSREGNPDLYVVPSDGGAPANLSSSPNLRELEPSWSPDGAWIAFVRTPPTNADGDIWTMRGDGSRRRRLTAGPSIDRQPSWSPDGSRIVFARSAETGGGLFVVGTDGSGLRRLTAPRGFDSSPAWSPDGRVIVFSSTRAGGFPQLYRVRAGGRGLRRLTTSRWIDANPAWSPDGTTLAFERCCPGGRSRILLMRVGDARVVDVTGSSVEASDPTWSPDGTRVAFTGYPRAGGPRRLYVVAIDPELVDAAEVLPAPSVTPLTEGPSDTSPSWGTQPAGAVPPPDADLPPARALSDPSLAGRAESGATAIGPEEAVPGPDAAAGTADGTTATTGRSRLASASLTSSLPDRYRISTRRVARGLRLMRIVDPRGPKRIFVLRANPDAALTLDVALGSDRLPSLERTSSMARRHGAIAAVNGDFGSFKGHPMNLFLEDGSLKQTSWIPWGTNFAISHDERNAFVGGVRQAVLASRVDGGEPVPTSRFNQDHPLAGEVAAYSPVGGTLFAPRPHACSARLRPSASPRWQARDEGLAQALAVDRAGCYSSALPRDEGVVVSALPGSPEATWIRSLSDGEVLDLSWSTGWPGVLDTLGGLPQLLRDGSVVPTVPWMDSSGNLFLAHPRTAVGVTATRKVLLVVVDGRRPGWSVGMRLPALARLLRRLGAVSAVNLDGGGSSTMVVRGRIVNRPSDPAGERHVSSALLVLPGADPGESGALRGTASATATAPGSVPQSLTAVGRDTRADASRRPVGPRLRSALRASLDPASTGGLVDAIARALAGSGRALPPELREVLQIYRSASGDARAPSPRGAR